jgi:hypothetical protein
LSSEKCRMFGVRLILPMLAFITPGVPTTADRIRAGWGTNLLNRSQRMSVAPELLRVTSIQATSAIRARSSKAAGLHS